MQEIEKIVQQEVFDIEVQYCDPDNCLYDCMHENYICDAYIVKWT